MAILEPFQALKNTLFFVGFLVAGMPQDLEYKPKAPLKQFYYITIIFIIFLPIKPSDMTIMWSGTLVFLLARLKKEAI